MAQTTSQSPSLALSRPFFLIFSRLVPRSQVSGFSSSVSPLIFCASSLAILDRRNQTPA